MREVLAGLIRQVRRRLASESAAAVVVAMIDSLLLQFFIQPRALADPRSLRRTLIHAVRRNLSP